MAEQEPSGWVVVFFRVDQPTVLGGTDSKPRVFAKREDADKYRRAIGEGSVKEFDYLKGAWARLTVWTIEAWWRSYRGESGPVVLPVSHLGEGLTVEDMNPQEYE